LSRRRPTTITDPQIADVLARAAEAATTHRVRRAPTQPPVRILIVDMERVALLGLQALFGAARNCEVVAQATTAEEAVAEAASYKPDVVVMDADLPGGSGIVAAQRIRGDNPSVRVVMFGSVAEPNIVIAAIRAGVHGYLLKRIEPARLVEAVELVAGGGYVFDDPLITAMQDWFRAGRPSSGPPKLSQQERRILLLVAEGKTNRDIAEALQLSEYTVKTYVSAALRKLGLASRAQAAAYIVQEEPD